MFTILYDSLMMHKLFLKWVSRLLTPDQKQQRVENSERSLELFKRVKKDFLHRYVIMDETWIQHYTSKKKDRQLGKQQLVKAIQSDQKLNSGLARLWLPYFVYRLL